MKAEVSSVGHLFLCAARAKQRGSSTVPFGVVEHCSPHENTHTRPGAQTVPPCLALPCPALQAKRAASAEGSDIPAIPVTVRQLEAVIRIAESLAKMQLQVGEMGPSFAQKFTSLWAGERVAAGAAEWRMGWGR